MAFHSDAELVAPLTRVEQELVLTALGPRAQIVNSRYFDNYDLPCPIRVGVRLPHGEVAHVVVRRCRHGDALDEADLLEALSEAGLPVPKVLGRSPHGPHAPAITILSCLPGSSLQALSSESPEGLASAQHLLIEAVNCLAGLTGRISKTSVGQLLHRRTLIGELRAITHSGSQWLEAPPVRRATARLTPALEAIDTLLVFSNGDYQPGNFLADDGRLTGFVDFESACFADPLIGFAKFPIYDLHPLNKAGFIGRMLTEGGWTAHDFAPRLALRCLETLVTEIPVHGGDRLYREHILTLLHEALNTMMAGPGGLP